jgi:integrase
VTSETEIRNKGGGSVSAEVEQTPAKRMKRGRRGSGEGSVYRRKSDGRWVGAAIVGYTAEGRPRRRVVYGATQREALEELRRLQEDARQGRIVEPHKLTVDSYLTKWLDSIAGPRLRPRTQEEYGRVLDHCRRHLGGLALAKLGKVHVLTLHAEWKREKLGARTQQASHRALFAALKDAQRLDLIAVNPAASVPAPRAPRREREVFDPAQLRRLLSAAEGDASCGALSVLLACSGLRLGEALGLAWKHVDLARGLLRVERVLSESKGKLSFQPPKTTRSKRTVELPARAIEALRAHRERLKATPHPDRLVFPDSRGKPQRRSNLVRRGWHPLCRTAKVPTLGLHALRHCHATVLLAGGVPIHVVASRLGHSTPNVTLSVYAHAFEQDGRAVAERVEALLGGGDAR